MPDAGRLDRRITIERYTSTTNSLNEEVRSWSELTTVWARRRDVGDGEKVAASQVSAHLMTRFLVRHSSVTVTVSPKDRISYDSETWNILGVKRADMGRNRFIEITAVREAD